VTDRPVAGAHGVETEPRIEIGAATHVGQVRTGNEDSMLCEPLDSALVAEHGLFFAVADGMGGHAAGEVASSMAVKTARDLFYASSDHDIGVALHQAIDRANAEVYEAGAGTTGRDHMGSTLTAVVLAHSHATVGHVGDSRCYIVRRGAIKQLTKDHSWVAEEVEAGLLTEEQARVHPRRNIITRALGLRPEVDIDVYDTDLEPGNLVVVCSDGLHGLVTNDEILAHVTRYRPADAVEALVRLANERGGPDNITVVVAQMVAEDEADTQPGILPMSDAPTPITTPPIATPALPPSAPTTPGRAPASEGPTTSVDLRWPEGDTPTTPTPAGPVILPDLRGEPADMRQGRRAGGIALIVVLLLLLALGAGIGVLMFRVAGLGG
jgi:serine/threonine protein phosphatase PrpC